MKSKVAQGQEVLAAAAATPEQAARVPRCRWRSMRAVTATTGMDTPPSRRALTALDPLRAFAGALRQARARPLRHVPHSLDRSEDGRRRLRDVLAAAGWLDRHDDHEGHLSFGRFQLRLPRSAVRSRCPALAEHRPSNYLDAAGCRCLRRNSTLRRLASTALARAHSEITCPWLGVKQRAARACPVDGAQ